MISNFKDIRVSAANRISATLNAYKTNSLTWLEPSSFDGFNFAEQKYGFQQYENYQDNQLYGLGASFRYTNRLKPQSDIHFVLPHGKSIGNVLWSKEFASRLPIACFSDLEKSKYQAIGMKHNFFPKLFSAVHPLVQFVSELSSINHSLTTINPSKADAIFFPLHSTTRVSSNLASSFSDYSKKINSLKAKYSSLNMCIYYIDFVKLKHAGVWEQFSSHFENVYCCGSRYDPAFFLNLAIILCNHNVLVTEGIGTHIFYSQMANMKLHLLNHSDSLSTYKFQDSNNRNDNQAREKNMSAHVHLHQTFDSNFDAGMSIIQRYIIKALTFQEQKELDKFIKFRLPLNHASFSPGFSEKRYPVID